jgi:signal transduction histidine kinase/ActR/RegA family two-component response regulator
MTYYVYIPVIATFIHIILMVLVLRSNFNAKINRIVALFLFSMAFWGFAVFSMRSSDTITGAILWDRIALCAAPLMTIVLYHASLELSRLGKPRFIMPVSYIAFFIFVCVAVATPLLVSDMSLEQYGYAPTYGILSIFLFPWIYTFIILTLITLVKFYRSSVKREERRQVVLIITGIVISLLGGLVDILRSFGLVMPPLGMITNILFGCLIAVAILKYRFLDLTGLLRKGLVYTLASGIAAAIYVLFILLLGRVFKVDQVSVLVNIVILLVIAIVLQPVFRQMQRLVDKWFYRTRYAHLLALETFTHETKDITDLNSLANSFVRLVTQAMYTKHSCLLLRDSTGEQFSIVAWYGYPESLTFAVKTRGALIRWLSQHETFLTREELDILPQLQAISVKEKKLLDGAEGELFVSLKVGDKLTGIMILGPKLSGEGYSDYDKSLLAIASRQLAIALDNARLYEESVQSYYQLKTAQDRLIASERLKALGEMTSGIAHDFNNALTTILGKTQLSLLRLNRNGSNDKTLIRDMELVEQSAQDAAQMVRRLQDFARVRKDRTFTSVDMNKIINSAIRMIKPRLDERYETLNIKTEVKLKLNSVSPIQGNESELREALVNILINSIDAMPKGGKITLESGCKGDYVVVTISDTGLGMSAEVRKKIFEPFFTTKGSKGLGMGLSVVYGSITRHSGEINVVSEPGEGTTFTIALPVSTGSEESLVSEAVYHEETPTARILVIDDDDGPRAVLSEMLIDAGYVVDDASSSRKGIEMAQQKGYNLVITDLGMPELSGKDVARAVKSGSPETKVILGTGWGVQLNQMDLVKLGVDDLINKPFNRDDVLSTVRKLLDHNAAGSTSVKGKK